MDSNIRIAFITPEAPPFSGGGIATFINNITKGLNDEEVFCEVFCPAVNDVTTITTLNGVTFHRIATSSISDFSTDVIPYFNNRHLEKKFTIVESCEIHASLFHLLKQKQKDIKYVVRVQMPAVYQSWLNDYYESRWLKLRYVLGAFRRLKWDLGFWNKVDVKRKANPEYLVCEMADAIIAPSNSFKNWLVNFWQLPANKIEVIYHLFDYSSWTNKKPKETFVKNSESIKVLFVGKLNAHKGVINLAKAARKIMSKYDKVEFVLIGEDWPTKYGFKEKNTGEIVQKIVKNNPRFKLTGKINYAELNEYYEAADICIFPSLWEAWGYTCTEAMSMGKAVIGSKNGGMADAIEHEVDGLLINPFSIEEIEMSLEKLILDKNLRIQFGEAARHTVATRLSFKNLTEKNIHFYQKILEN